MNIRTTSCSLGMLVWTFVLTSPVDAQWQPPIGVPAPAFGITQQAPASPSPWTSPVAGFYYVNQAGGTDTNNLYGTPALPRATIPNTLPPGAVVEVRGNYTRRHTSPNNLIIQGTVAQPVFVRGLSVAQRTLATSAWEISGQYFVVENIEFAISTAEVAVSILSPSANGSFRNNVVRGNANGGGMDLTSYSPSPDVSTNIVIYNNIVRDNGNVNATFDQDVHGIDVGRNQSSIWIVDNEIARNSGDGVQANSEGTSHHLYFGRNLVYSNKQTGLWSKRNRDVIFSQNFVHSHRPSNSSSGAGLGFQYGPERIWFLFNHIHACEFGIVGASGQDANDGLNVYVIGNVIHNIHQLSGNPDGSGWASAAVMLNGGTNRFVINNTFHDVDAGINSPADGGNFSIVNNITSGLAVNKGSHVFLEKASLANASSISNSMFEGTARVKWGSSTIYNVPGFQAATGKCAGCLAATPLYPAGENYAIPANALAVDTGITHAVYATFQSLYGISISRDITGMPRPSFNGFDMGAYEVQCIPPSMSLGDVSLNEGDSGSTLASFPVSLTTPGCGNTSVSVNYGTADGTANVGSDYGVTTGTLVIPPGALGGTISVPVLGDRIGEANETFSLTLSLPGGATLSDAQGIATITNDDTPGLVVSDALVTEPRSGGLAQATFFVSLFPSSGSPVTVTAATNGGTAAAGADFVPTVVPLVFDPGQTVKVVTVSVNPDALVERMESFTLDLAGEVGAAVAVRQGVGRILDPQTAGDMNGDGGLDLLWQRNDGSLVAWFMNGVNRTSFSFLNPSIVSDTNYKIVGTGFFNEDSEPDILWQHQTSGALLLWYMNGVTRQSWASLSPSAVTDTNWKVVGTGDFNYDGRPDILWRRNVTGEIVVWYMNNATRTGFSTIDPRVPDANWLLQTTADLSGDGKTDLVWQHATTGMLLIWTLEGAVRTNAVLINPQLTAGSAGWRIVSAPDVNNDGSRDLVWRHATTGDNLVWYMNLLNRSTFSFLNPQTVDLSWRIVGPR